MSDRLRAVFFGIAVTSVQFANCAALAQQPAAFEFTHQIVDGKKVRKPWSDIVGKRVHAEGLAWGALDKGLGPRVILDNAVVHVSGIDYLKRDLNGKTIRVEGILRIEHVKAAPPGAQGFGGDFSYYFIEADRAEAIERVSAPWLQEILPSARISK